VREVGYLKKKSITMHGNIKVKLKNITVVGAVSGSFTEPNAVTTRIKSSRR